MDIKGHGSAAGEAVPERSSCPALSCPLWGCAEPVGLSLLLAAG